VRSSTILGIALALLGPGAVAFLWVQYAAVSESLAIRSLGLLAFVALVARSSSSHGVANTWLGPM